MRGILSHILRVLILCPCSSSPFVSSSNSEQKLMALIWSLLEPLVNGVYCTHQCDEHEWTQRTNATSTLFYLAPVSCIITTQPQHTHSLLPFPDLSLSRVGDSGCQPFSLQHGLTCYLSHFSSCVAPLPLQLISYKEPTAVRRSGCSNQQPPFFGQLPDSKCDHLILLESPSVGWDGSLITGRGQWQCHLSLSQLRLFKTMMIWAGCHIDEPFMQ